MKSRHSDSLKKGGESLWQSSWNGITANCQSWKLRNSRTETVESLGSDLRGSKLSGVRFQVRWVLHSLLQLLWWLHPDFSWTYEMRRIRWKETQFQPISNCGSHSILEENIWENAKGGESQDSRVSYHCGIHHPYHHKAHKSPMKEKMCRWGYWAGLQIAEERDHSHIEGKMNGEPPRVCTSLQDNFKAFDVGAAWLDRIKKEPGSVPYRKRANGVKILPRGARPRQKTNQHRRCGRDLSSNAIPKLYQEADRHRTTQMDIWIDCSGGDRRGDDTITHMS